MNKATKGAIAAGAAGILLLGGAGTFALWEDTDSVDPASISTGVLTMAVGAGSWYDATAGTTGTITNIADFDIVPGDTITYTTPVTITAEGDNLDGEFKILKTAFETSAETAAPYLNVTVASNAATVPGLVVNGTTGAITFASAGTYSVNVTVTVVFENVTGVIGQNADIDLTALALKLEQA
ncbi:alternate-type signal peptide domain-containing protein [Arthrobacter sp. R4-81]